MNRMKAFLGEIDARPVDRGDTMGPRMSAGQERRANLEIKAACRDPEGTLRACRALGARQAGSEIQTDTYFSVGRYRLKLRETSTGKSELIGYARADRRGARLSSYRVVPVPDPGAKKRILSRAMGVKVVVRKRRTVFLYEGVRIHIDAVEGLGAFVELEGVLGQGETEESMGERLQSLCRELAMDGADMVSGSYSDLLLERG